MTSRHPELSAEQQVVNKLHDCHEDNMATQRAIIAGEHNGGADPRSERDIREKAIARLDALEAVETQGLVIGRCDFKDEKLGSRYIAKCLVPCDGRVAAVDFTNKLVRGFYRADESDPMGLVRRRTFNVSYRELRDMVDEVFGKLPPALRKPTDEPADGQRTVLDRVAAELERAREPRMHDIVATIVADQYRMIEAPREGVFVIQGGPGTGKTAVALHRAVYLIRNNEDLGKVLVVGPNVAFMAYIGHVLPGLGETAVDQVVVDRLAETGEAQVREADEPELAALKGDARMATILARALRQRVRPADDDFSIRVEGVNVRLTAHEVNEAMAEHVERDLRYMDQRTRFRDALRAEVERQVQETFARRQRRRSVDREGLQRQLNNDNNWMNWLERLWPTMSAAQLVHEVLTIEQRLVAAAAGELTDAEVSLLIRKNVRTVGVHPWTPADMPLIDEAQEMVQGGRSKYGYVIVDEAQDLTPMQLRMVARRSSTADLTLVGDIAQATGPVRHRSWDQIVEHLPTERGITRDELTIGYRVPRSIMDLANLLLPQVAPELTPTEPVREAKIDPQFHPTEGGSLAEIVAEIVVDLDDGERSVGVIAPARHITDVRGGLAAWGIQVGDISTDQLERRVTLLSSAEAKGLEFDRVVLVEPWDVVVGSDSGWSELYVALSRATQQLDIVHARPLPAPLPGGEEVLPTEFERPRAEPADEVDVPVGVEEIDLDLDLDLDALETSAPTPGDGDKEARGPDEPAEPAEDETAEEAIVLADEEADRVGAAPAEPNPAGDSVDVAVEARDLEIAPTLRPVARRPAPTQATAPRLSGDFSEALVVAKMVHDGCARRGTAVPYMSHLLGTVALVLEDGGTESEAIAALLHDAVEDGSPDVAETIRRRFGDAIADAVEACTDPTEPAGFRERKEEHFRKLERGSTSARRVALAEKLDNARALLRDLERYGADTWSRMEVEQETLLWYYEQLVDLFKQSFPSVLAGELERVVARIQALATSRET